MEGKGRLDKSLVQSLFAQPVLEKSPPSECGFIPAVVWHEILSLDDQRQMGTPGSSLPLFRDMAKSMEIISSQWEKIFASGHPETRECDPGSRNCEEARV